MKRDSRLLINEHPLQVLPSLAVAVGLNEALFIQQVHYWLDTSKHVHEERRWIYNSYEEWQKQLPFWSVSTIRRIVANLEEQGVLLVGHFSSNKLDRTKWYTINYDAIDSLVPSAETDRPSAQNEQTGMTNLDSPICSDWSHVNGTETTQETTSRDYDAGGTAKTVVGALIDLDLLRGQAIALVKRNPALDLSAVDQWREWLAASESKNPLGLMIAHLKEGRTHPPSNGTRRQKNMLPPQPELWLKQRPDGSHYLALADGTEYQAQA